MDLSNLDTTATAEDGAWLHLCHPATGAPLYKDQDDMPIRIRVRGQDSSVARRMETQMADRRLNRRAKKLSAEEIEREGLDLLTALVVEWEGIVLHGEDVPCTPENVRQVLKQLRWVREQIDTFVGDRANFLPMNSPKPSKSRAG